MSVADLANILHDLGGYAMAAVFGRLWWLERQDKKEAQAKFDNCMSESRNYLAEQLEN
jgi:hypothetical protein